MAECALGNHAGVADTAKLTRAQDGAQMSERHANFVINRGHATASQIRELTGIVKQRVLDRFGVELEEEVLLVGDWD